MLGDEVNRAPAKTQAALLEAMQERQVTVDGTTYRLPRPFLVVATQNPIEHEGTYALPEAQLDRFLLRTRMGYPAADDEAELLTRRVDRGTDDVELTAVGSVEAILGLQAAVERVHVEPAMARYVVALAQGTRDDAEVEVGVSPRGSLALLKLARAYALGVGATSWTPTTSRPSPSLPSPTASCCAARSGCGASRRSRSSSGWWPPSPPRPGRERSTGPGRHRRRLVPPRGLRHRRRGVAHRRAPGRPAGARRLRRPAGPPRPRRGVLLPAAGAGRATARLLPEQALAGDSLTLEVQVDVAPRRAGSTSSPP